MGAIYWHLTEEKKLSREAVSAALSAWEIIELKNQGRVVGEVMKSGKEIHVALDTAYRHGRGFSRKNIIDVLGRLLAEETFLVTKLARGDENHGRFAKRLGFEKVRSDEDFDYYWLGSSPYLRASK